MKKHLAFRQILTLLLFSALGTAIVGCGDDQNGGSGGGDPGDEGVRITHEDETLVANTQVSSVNTFWLDEGNQFVTTVIAGWIGKETGAFGAVTVRLNLVGPEGHAVGPGVYALTTDAMSHEAMTAHLGLSGVEMESVEDIAGIVDRIVGAEGTLEIKALEQDAEGKLDRIEFDFDGTFVDVALTDEPIGEVELALSGSVHFKKK